MCTDLSDCYSYYQKLIYLKGGKHGFFKNFFTCMHSLRNNMYNCMIVFLNSKFYKVKGDAQKHKYLHCIGFFRVAVITRIYITS